MIFVIVALLLSLLPLSFSIYYFPLSIALFLLRRGISHISKLKYILAITLLSLPVIVFLPQPMERLFYVLSLLIFLSLEDWKNIRNLSIWKGKLVSLDLAFLYKDVLANKWKRQKIAAKTKKSNFISPLNILHFLFRRAKMLSLALESKGYSVED